MADYGYIWLQVKVRECGLGFRPRLNSGLVCDDSSSEATYAAIAALRK